MSAKLLVIGGVAGGATAAARARRVDEHARIIIFERGEYISFANCGLPYYIGGVIEKRDDLLVTTREALMNRYNIEIRTTSEVLAIDRKRKEVTVRDLSSGKTYNETYDKVILSPGAEPFKPPLRGADLPNIYHLRTMSDMDQIKAAVDSHKPGSAVVVGAGFIGLEMAENLMHRGVNTTIVEMLEQVMPPLDMEMAAIVQAHLREQGLALELGTTIESFEQNGGKILVYTSKGTPIETDMVILSVGVRPENKLAVEAGLEIGTRGGIKVGPDMSTSDPDIFAVGDAVEIRSLVTGAPTMTALAGPANKQARIAADNAMGRRSVFKGAIGTSIVKVFNLTVAGTGANERTLKEENHAFIASYTHSGSHASYYPGAKPMAVKLLFSPSDGHVLGAQIVGEEGVDKRIDVLATAISGKMTVFNLEELELAYAPPYSSAKDPVNVAGFVAANILKGDVKSITWRDLNGMDWNQTVLIDLRTREEIEESGQIPGSIHIRQEELRDNLDRLDPHKTYILYCAVGMRGYLGYRTMVQNGFRSFNLSGAYRTFLGAKEEIMKESDDFKLWLSE